MVGRPVHELEEQLTAPEVLEYRAYWKLKDAAEKIADAAQGVSEQEIVAAVADLTGAK